MTTFNDLQEFPVLHTNRLILRKLNTQDAHYLYNNFSCDREVSRYCDSYGPNSINDAADAIKGWNEQFGEKTFIRWGITFDNDAVIGTISASPLFGKFNWNPVAPVEIGYDLSRKNWNRGIMTETVTRVVEFLCAELNVTRIQAIVDPQNKASSNVLKKVGFNEEGLLRLYSYHTGTKEINDRIMFSFINPNYIKTW